MCDYLKIQGTMRDCSAQVRRTGSARRRETTTEVFPATKRKRTRDGFWKDNQGSVVIVRLMESRVDV